MQTFILIAPNGLIDFKSLSSTRGAAQYAVVGTRGDDDRFHTWGWWKERGWRCVPCEVVILSPTPNTTDEE
jgi:uncharacterized membrane protein